MAKLPEFKNEEEIFDFFEIHSGADFMDDAEELELAIIEAKEDLKNGKVYTYEEMIKEVG